MTLACPQSSESSSQRAMGSWAWIPGGRVAWRTDGQSPGQGDKRMWHQEHTEGWLGQLEATWEGLGTDLG